MELIKSCIITFFLLFLLLTSPYHPVGGLPELDSEVYEIDYRGPETHTSIPPPDHSHHGKPMIRHENVVVPPKSKGAKGNGKKVHG